MRQNSSMAVLAIVSAFLSGCTTMSEQDYRLGQKAVAESPTVRAEVLRDCIAKQSRKPKSSQREIAAFMNVPESAYAQTICNRMVRAFAKGRLSYDDVTTGRSDEKILEIIKGH
jgi:hypothetical protein